MNVLRVLKYKYYEETFYSDIIKLIDDIFCA